MRFEDLRLRKPLLDAVRTAGYGPPTPIQAKAIPLVLEGKDVLASAQTGTGKTAAFALPILQRLADDKSQKRNGGGRTSARTTRALVLAPTRELAQQISDCFSRYGRFSGIRHEVVFGGVNKNTQARALRTGVDILVATPGRLLDHISDGVVALDSIQVLVLDEADRMLDMGFLPDIRRILARVPKRRQTLLLSATMPPSIRRLAEDILTHPVSVEVARASSPAETVEHLAYRVEKNEKPALLCHVLSNTPYSRVLVFTRTKYGADKVVRHLTRSGIAANAIHGNKSQNARTRALAGFRSGKTAVLVATDIAARGLDIDDVSHVINYDLTADPETYVHRIGRTGRAGATGTALSFVSGEDRESLRDIERLIRRQLQQADDLPGSVPGMTALGNTDNERATFRRTGESGGNGRRAPTSTSPRHGRRRRRRRSGVLVAGASSGRADRQPRERRVRKGFVGPAPMADSE